VTVAESALRPKRGRETLEAVLRRRSVGAPPEGGERAAPARLSLEVLTRNAEGTVVDVPLEALQPNPFQPRFQFHRQPLEELAQSLAAEGQLEPAIARRLQRDGGQALEIVAGARRLEAAKICNATIRPFPTLRVDVRELSDEEAERIALTENLQRENLTPLEEGYRYWQLQQRDPRRWSVRAIAEFVHKKKSSVQNRLGLVKDAAVAEAVLREEIPPTAGFHILRLPAPEREGYLRAAIAQRRTVEQIKGDVERRLAPRRPTLVVHLDGSGSASGLAGGASGAVEGWLMERSWTGAEDAGNEDEVAPDVVVRQHRRRRAGVAGDEDTPAARHAAAEALQAERRRLLAQMEALETELHQCQLALRNVERDLAALS
jgi:ParB family transcriptional regulator, chromosome partitioning protein